MSKKILKVVAGKKIYSSSQQHEPVAACETCGWKREGLNASGVGIRHAASKRHSVQVTKYIVTRYDGITPDVLEPDDEPGVDTQASAVVE